MKFTSALTLTTILSVMSAAHGAPILSVNDAPSAAPSHFRRASQVSELQGGDYEHNPIMDGLNAAFETGNGIRTLLKFVKRQLGASNTGTDTSSETTTSSDDAEEPYEQTSTTSGDASVGLMGGDITSTADAGFAYEPGQGIKAT